jgi:hypothetical protein
MVNFENKRPSEDADIAEIVKDILTVQAAKAAEQGRPLGRGTHTKGVGVRATFEVFDLGRTIADRALAARLAQGPYAKPGVYDALVRFANAASRINPDSEKDVRAVSFTTTIGTRETGTGSTRLDYSLNNAPVFPLNDARAFASFMKFAVAQAHSKSGALKALWRMTFKDTLAFLRTARLGKSQERRPSAPYQKERYWSNVPFRHGANDAIKYSLIPSPSNPSRPLGNGPHLLRDELVRHVTEDEQMSSFDFAVQLLDPERMTYRGMRRRASFWIENASVEWNEAQAPFHVIGRLTLIANSQISDDELASMYIDVTEHSTPETRPLGSINRARWYAETAGRNARLANATPGQALLPVSLTPPSRSPITLRTAFKTIAALALLAMVGIAGFSFYLMYKLGPALQLEEVSETINLDQGWGTDFNSPARQTYYYTGQGAGVKGMRYSWFVNLENPWGKTRFADPNNMRTYGFIVDEPSPANPDQLPIGFAKHFDRQVNDQLLDVTCAACHTGQLRVTRGGTATAIRIDGGQAMHAFTALAPGQFGPNMIAAMISTATNPLKFRRFAHKVLGNPSLGDSLRLHRELRAVIAALGGPGFTEWWRKLSPTHESFGRTDALARIGNAVFAENLDPVNYSVGDAPVSFPPVWNIWKFDWVQYNASVSQPMARNIGEAMGVGAKYALLNSDGRPLPPGERFRSSSLLLNLDAIEKTLRTLQPPAWSERHLGAIDRGKAQRGRELFDQHCLGCHGPFIAQPEFKAVTAPLKGPDDPLWLLKTICVVDIGTDPNAAMNFYGRRVDISKTGMTAADLSRVALPAFEDNKSRQLTYLNGQITQATAKLATLRKQVTPSPDATNVEQQLAALQAQLTLERQKQPPVLDPRNLSAGEALSYLGTMIRKNAYTDQGFDADRQKELDGYGTLDLPQVLPAYRPRPLAGLWATPPFLHNGSVPTLYHLLSPVAERPKNFLVGSRDFDPVHVGLVLREPGTGNGATFDTSLPGNSNAGHEFNNGYVEWERDAPPQNGLIGPWLSPEDRLAIIEHLKVRNDDRDGPQEPRYPEWPGTCKLPTELATSRSR